MKNLIPLCLACLLVLGLAGCITPAPGPRSQFYQLQPSSEDPKEASSGEGPVVRIGPLQVSDYLNNPQLATRIGEYQVSYDELRRWAEPLYENILWVLTQELVHSLPEVRIIPFTEMPTMVENTLSVPVRVSRLEQRPDGTVLLQASWLVIQRAAPHEATPERVTLTQAAASGATENIVAAQSALIQELSEKIADDIRAALK